MVFLIASGVGEEKMTTCMSGLWQEKPIYRLFVRFVARKACLQAVCQVCGKKRLLTACLSGLRQEYSDYNLLTVWGDLAGYKILYNCQ